MKHLKLAWFMLAAGIFILIFNVLLGSSLVEKYIQINGQYSTRKVSANLQGNAGPTGKKAFSQEDIRHLQEFSLKDRDLAYAAEDKSFVIYEENQVMANVTGISGRYSMFHQMELKSGSLITQGNKDERVAVVDEELAVELYNNTNVLGLYVELYGQKFRIIGVITQDKTIIQSMTGNGYGSIYIPVEHMLEYNPDTMITSLEARAPDSGTTGRNISSMEEALVSIGKNASDYKIIDYNIGKKVVGEKAQIGIFISGVGIIVLLLLSIGKRVKDIHITISTALKDNYIMDALRLNFMRLALIMAEIIAAALFILLVWNTVRFDIYIPAEYIPDELINLKFWSELFESLMHNEVRSLGYIPSFQELRANSLNAIQGWNMLIGIFAGFPLYYLGLKLLEPRRTGAVKDLVYCCIFIFSSVVAGTLALNIVNMPAVINTRGVMIVSAFVLLSFKEANKKFL